MSILNYDLLTAEYYRKKAEDFTAKAMQADPEDFLSVFVSKLKANALILDLGCGCGRDLLWLKNLGFRAYGLEASSELAEIARRYSSCTVFEADFTNWDFKDFNFDALLFSGSLVHIPALKLEGLLSSLLFCLAEEGFIYISLKEGLGSGPDKDGRFFQYWQKEEAELIWQNLKLEIISFDKQISNQNTSWLSWVLKK